MHHIRFAPVLGVCLGAMLGINSAMAAFPEEEEGVRVTAGAGYVYDNNLFLLPDSATPPTSSEKSDQIRTVYAGLLVDKSVELQRFKLSARLDHASYNRFSFLDYDTKSLNGVWEWAAMGGQWKGDLGYDRTESLNSFLDLRNLTKNIRTNRNIYFNGGYGFRSDWQVRVHAANRESTNDSPIRADSDIEIKTVGAGVRYQPTTENLVELLAKRGRGNYFNSLASEALQVDNSFDDNELELNGQWKLTGKSRINGALKYVDWQYPTFSARDFSGWAGRIEHRWSITGKTSLQTSLRHDLYPYIDTGVSNSSYVVVDKLTLAPEWQATAKITVRAVLSRAVREFRGQLAGGFARDDALNTAGLTVEYLPLRTARLSATVQKMKRTSNLADYEFDDRFVSLNADVAF